MYKTDGVYGDFLLVWHHQKLFKKPTLKTKKLGGHLTLIF